MRNPCGLSELGRQNANRLVAKGKETMSINSIFFTGETPPHMLPNPIAALIELNAWRSRNPSLRLISIETVQRIPVQTDPGERFIEPQFDLLRVWFED